MTGIPIIVFNQAPLGLITGGYALEEAYEERIPSKIIPIPVDKVGWVMGQKYKNLRRLQETYQVEIELEKNSMNPFLKVYGPLENCELVEKDILDNMLTTINFPIEKQDIGRLVGRRGRTIKALCQETQVKIEIPSPTKHPGVLVISGRSSNCTRALVWIQQFFKQSDDEVPRTPDPLLLSNWFDNLMS